MTNAPVPLESRDNPTGWDVPLRRALPVLDYAFGRDAAVGDIPPWTLGGGTAIALRMAHRLAMDNFGTGYSSSGYLRSFPFEKIKIDGCFVRDIETSRDCKAIVEAVTGLGANLDIVTTAEGVATLAQLNTLQAAGCRQAPGFYFNQPVPADEVQDLLAGDLGRPYEFASRAGRNPVSDLPEVA